MFMRKTSADPAAESRPARAPAGTRHLMSARSLSGNEVYNRRGEDLGDVRDLMIDMDTGCVAYAVLSFGGFLRLGDKRFAVPWAALSLDTLNNHFVLNVERATRPPRPSTASPEPRPCGQRPRPVGTRPGPGCR